VNQAVERSRWSRLAVASWAVIGVLVLFAGFLWLLDRLGPVITPLALAGVIVFFLKGPVNWLEDRGINRTLAVVIAYLVGIALLSVFFTIIAPLVGERVGQFVQEFPAYYDRALEIWTDVQMQYRALDFPDWVTDTVSQAQDQVITSATDLSQRMASGLFAAGGQAVGFVFNLVMSAVIAFYLLKDLPRIRTAAFRLVPEERRSEAHHLYGTVIGAIGGYIRGQIIVAAFVGVLAYVVLAILGVPFPLVIGLITGIFNVVPYLGAFIGAGVAAIAAAFVDPWLALWAVLGLVAVQQIEGLFISPRVMSEQVDLHPVAVILALLAGGTLLGFVGLLIAIPLAAAGKGVLVYYMQKHGDWCPQPRHKVRFDFRSLVRRSRTADTEEDGS
jgi:predicted PurR-regulated permease PerM